jgi:hypothetical protein
LPEVETDVVEAADEMRFLTFDRRPPDSDEEVLLAGCESEWPMEKRLDSRCDFFLSAMVVGVFWTGEEGSGRPQRRAEGRRVGVWEDQRVRWACYTASVQCFIQDAQGSGTNERGGRMSVGTTGTR